jgi:hypothetical protein
MASGFPGCFALSIVSDKRSIAVFSAPVTSPIERDTSVAVLMARCPIPASVVCCGVSMVTFVLSKAYFGNGSQWHPAVITRPPPLAIRASACFEQRVKDLWLSATGAVCNNGG